MAAVDPVVDGCRSVGGAHHPHMAVLITAGHSGWRRCPNSLEKRGRFAWFAVVRPLVRPLVLRALPTLTEQHGGNHDGEGEQQQQDWKRNQQSQGGAAETSVAGGRSCSDKQKLFTRLLLVCHTIAHLSPSVV